ncbi:LOW QUALITY PROTEIN: transcriptional regulator, TetR family [Bacillus sp. JCM 19046]|nr:LOW QUALITY PROTEIN: transcriptional regulator, TetR family [Bacillus sp. JCM 19046]
MKDKRTQLIEAAMRLFANKGFHTTSIQEIVTESGMSKGAFYLHFSSKDELILAIFQYYYGRLWEKVTAVAEENLSPKQTFEKQLEVQFKEIISHREFIMMQFQEQGLAQIEKWRSLEKRKKRFLFWHQTILLSIYGEDLKPHDVDAVIMLEGLTQTYFQMILLNHVTLSEKQLARYILNRLDDLISALNQRQEAPLMTEAMMKPLLHHSCFPHGQEKVAELIKQVQHKMTTLSLSESKHQDLYDALQVIAAEYKKEEPKKVVFQGMLLTFADVAELSTEHDQLAALLTGQ